MSSEHRSADLPVLPGTYPHAQDRDLRSSFVRFPTLYGMECSADKKGCPRRLAAPGRRVQPTPFFARSLLSTTMTTAAEFIDNLLLCVGGDPISIALAEFATTSFFAVQRHQLWRDCYAGQEQLMVCHEIVPRNQLARPVVHIDTFLACAELFPPGFDALPPFLHNGIQKYIRELDGLHVLTREAQILRVLRDAHAVVETLLNSAGHPARTDLIIGELLPVWPVSKGVEKLFKKESKTIRSKINHWILRLPLNAVVGVLSCSASLREAQNMLHAFPHWARGARRVTSLTFITVPLRRNAEAWDLGSRFPNLVRFSLANPLSNVAQPRAPALRLQDLAIDMADHAGWQKHKTETTLDALGDALVRNITFYDARAFVLSRYFRNERDPPAHVSLSVLEDKLFVAVEHQSGKTRTFNNLDGGVECILSRDVLAVVRSLKLPNVLPPLILRSLFAAPAPELETLEITLRADDDADPHPRLLARRNGQWLQGPKLVLLRLSASGPETCAANAEEIRSFMTAVSGRMFKLERVNVDMDGCL
ncbi:hypothetical protein AURDEDRAFT_187014 [Auricularia subglabra TFB-10046 SS5]|nr:hypothetical protein AURDEDRAFT_187014 [Auricularia subglabra TFB-10046 SS5]